MRRSLSLSRSVSAQPLCDIDIMFFNTFAQWVVYCTRYTGYMVRLVELSKQQIQYGICTINNEKSICRATAAPAMTRPKTHHGPNGPERDRRKGKYIHTIFHSFARILFPIHSAHRVRIWCVRFSVIFAVCASFSICLCVFLSHSLIHSVDVCVCCRRLVHILYRVDV